jgi:Serine/threonine protein phosphatase
MNRDYILAADTDIGLTKTANQDSVFLRNIYHPEAGSVVLAVICDGMGGLEKGEVASSSVVREFETWFSALTPGHFRDVVSSRWVYDEFNHLIQKQNQTIHDYGREHRIRLGTTATVMLIADKSYYIIHVGDTRVYELTQELTQLTEDQTVVAREVKNGKMTPEQARTDPRRNVLLQCIGASERVVPQFLTGDIREEAVYLLCTDGFRHELMPEEIYQYLNPQVLADKEQSQIRIRQLIDLNKQRNESDNITAAVIHT